LKNVLRGEDKDGMMIIILSALFFLGIKIRGCFFFSPVVARESLREQALIDARLEE